MRGWERERAVRIAKQERVEGREEPRHARVHLPVTRGLHGRERLPRRGGAEPGPGGEVGGLGGGARPQKTGRQAPRIPPARGGPRGPVPGRPQPLGPPPPPAAAGSPPARPPP